MIEIEKKFLLTETQQAQLLEGAINLGSKRVEDSYFDTADYQLTTKDYWLRLRDGAYELKAPLKSTSSSPSTTNRYHEITDTQEISHELGLNGSIDFELALSQADIKRFMTCYTNRTSYKKDSFRIDSDDSYLDSAFTYALAEIEVIIKSEAEADDAERKIIEFAKRFNLTTDQLILGKVLAYLKAVEPRHYNALVAAGIA